MLRQGLKETRIPLLTSAVWGLLDTALLVEGETVSDMLERAQVRFHCPVEWCNSWQS